MSEQKSKQFCVSKAKIKMTKVIVILLVCFAFGALFTALFLKAHSNPISTKMVQNNDTQHEFDTISISNRESLDQQRLLDLFVNDHKCIDTEMTLEEMLKVNNTWISSQHHFIQWWFPNYIPSKFNQNAPQLTDKIVSRLLKEHKFIKNLERLFNRMKTYYEQVKYYKSEFNHEHLRITRIINCLKIFGLGEKAIEFGENLLEETKDYNGEFKKKWKEAMALQVNTRMENK